MYGRVRAPVCVRFTVIVLLILWTYLHTGASVIKKDMLKQEHRCYLVISCTIPLRGAHVFLSHRAIRTKAPILTAKWKR